MQVLDGGVQILPEINLNLFLVLFRVIRNDDSEQVLYCRGWANVIHSL